MRSTIPAADAAACFTPGPVRIGCAGWSIPRDAAPRFPVEGSHLQRYAAVLSAVEINSSFYRPHREVSYRRWAESTPPDFRFSVKLPKTITHEQRLGGASACLLDAFLPPVQALGERLGCLLVQLPPTLAFDAVVANAFLERVRRRHAGAVALEPRHASWFAAEAEAVLCRWQIARVLADPVLHAAGTSPGGWTGLVYCRLHGAPRIYYSAYSAALLEALAPRLDAARQAGSQTWCIFDNTALGAAALDALALTELLRGRD